jgi:N-methylhydantoinase A/oxoprolinase/acetone carboxylase beta subunit
MAGKKNFIIGIDTRGTFTDFVVPGDGGEAGAAIFRVVW